MDQPDPPPDKIGKYSIIRRLGIGGMAEVFEAKMPGVAGFSKTVVLKKILPQLATQPTYVEMFVREAKIAAAVQHRCVVQVFELDQLDSGEYFMVMEFVRGPDLRQMLSQAGQAKRRIPPWFSIFCIAEVLDGLDYAYNSVDDAGRPRKMIHRDVTPSNIFVSMLGEVKLGDFGVARDDTFEPETGSGQHKGKLAYMAPEQLQGNDVDGRLDVFSAGVVLWECLTQSRLFGGKPDNEIMNAIVNLQRKPPSLIKADVGKEIDSIVLDALEPDPSKRIPSAKKFRARLLDALHKKHGSVLSEDVRKVVEVFLGKRVAEEVLEPSGTTPTGARAFGLSGSLTGLAPVKVPAPPARQEPPTAPLVVSAPSSSAALTRELVLTDAERALVEHGRLRAVVSRDVVAGVPLVPTPQGVTPPLHVPRPRAPTPLPPGVKLVSGVPSRPSDVDALVVSAVSSIDPRDIKSQPARQPHVIAGLDLRRHAAFVADKALERWSSFGIEGAHKGPYPHWLRDGEGHSIGPVSFDQAQGIFRMEAAARLAGVSGISGDGARWISMQRYAELTGQDVYVRDDDAKKPAASLLIGQLKSRSVPSVFSMISRRKMTGRLSLLVESSRRIELRELDVAEGRPCAMYSNVESMQLLALLKSRQVLPEALVPELMWKVLLVDRPLMDVASAQLSKNLENYRAALEREKWMDVFAMENANIYFDPRFRPHQRPFAPSLLPMLPWMVVKAYDTASLRQRLGQRMDVVLRPAPTYVQDIADLGLAGAQLEAIEPIAKGRKVAQQVKMYPSMEKALLPLVYLLLEINALV